jgi:hypothetical protein
VKATLLQRTHQQRVRQAGLHRHRRAVDLPRPSEWKMPLDATASQRRLAKVSRTTVQTSSPISSHGDCSALS